MTTYLNSPVKEVIDHFPEVGEILADYQVGCVTCGVGTCLLKDIIEIHHLSAEDEQAAMGRIAKVVSGDGVTTATERVAPELAEPGEATASASADRPGAAPAGRVKAAPRYSPPMQQLVDEHLLIKRWLALIPEVLESIDVQAAEDRQLILDGVDFIRSYADRFHHAKEEDILFKYFDETQAIIQAMLTDHDKARAHARGAADAVESRDKDAIAEHLSAYRALLGEHIKKEDEILYPWMDRDLTTSQVGELFRRFAEVDKTSGIDVGDKYSRFVTRAEEIVGKRRERIQ
ncbi:MAG: hypothetical protein A2133_02370 [Actinobacteria bacterium RBG_16_64_13]|nr:MAG: hypothetical protein A2133_02370 [Actinobacteria bacterium RBG_16_64_13]